MYHPWFHTMDDSGETPVSRVQKSGYRLLAELLLKHDREYPPEQTPAPSSSLHHAAYWGLSDAVSALLARGADPRQRDEHGDTPLHQAARNGHKETVEALIAHGADINEKNQFGMTCLHWVALNGREDLAETLLDHGAEVNARDDYTNGLTPMAMALLMGYDRLVAFMGTHGGHL